MFTYIIIIAGEVSKTNSKQFVSNVLHQCRFLISNTRFAIQQQQVDFLSEGVIRICRTVLSDAINPHPDHAKEFHLPRVV
jgi:hypothetical protein